MLTLVLGATLVASLLAPPTSPVRGIPLRAACAPATTDISSWPIVRSPKVPGLTLRLPRAFEREQEASPPSSATPSGTTARWSHAAQGQIVISRGAAPAGMMPSSSAGAPAYSRCEEKVGSADAVIESYDRGAPAGGSTFHVQARFRWPDGEEIVVLGDAADRERFGELLAAVRTIRRTSA
jgi:hypothetical protein